MKRDEATLLAVVGGLAAWAFFSRKASAADTWQRVPSGLLQPGEYRIAVTNAPNNSMQSKQVLASRLRSFGWTNPIVYVGGDALPADWPSDDAFGWLSVYRAQATATVGAVTVPENVAVWRLG